MGSARSPRSMPWTPHLPGLCDLRCEGSQRPPEHERHVERHAQAVAHHQQHPDLSRQIHLYQLKIVRQQQVQLLPQSTLSMLLQLLLLVMRQPVWETPSSVLLLRSTRHECLRLKRVAGGDSGPSSFAHFDAATTDHTTTKQHYSG